MTDKFKLIIDNYIKLDWFTDKKAGGTLCLLLRYQNKTYRHRYGNARTRIGIANREDIDERPAIANDRQRVGDWAGDTIFGKAHKGAIVTIDERV